MKHLFFIALAALSFATPVIAQNLTQSQITAAQEALAQADVDQDEVARRLRAKGIDLENVTADQLQTLEEDIRQVIEEIKAEQEGAGDAENGSDGPVQDSNTSTKGTENNLPEDDETGDFPQDSIDQATEKRLKDLSRRSADEIRERMKEGYTLDEAIYGELTEDERRHYAARSSVYGMDIFFNNSLDFYTGVSSTTTPDSYVLDVGDKIAINIFGASQADLMYEIEEDGFIRPSKATRMSKIYLKGVTLGKAKTLLRNRFNQAYLFNSDQFEVSLHTARTITVNIFGEVQAPGSYTISALNTALNALLAAGGPGAEASLRNIKIMSSSGDRTLDVYKFMTNPDAKYNFYLRNNDVIFIPKYDTRISVNGPGIRRSATYEIARGETYKDVVELAGGYATNMYKGLVQHIYTENGEQMLKDYSLEDAEKAKIKLGDGNMLVFHSYFKAYENFVSISGAVRHKGRFELQEGMRISDLLDKAILEEEAFSDMAYLTRKNIDGTFQLKRVYVRDIIENPDSEKNFELQDEDRINLFSIITFTDKYQFSISGAVRRPGTHFWDPEQSITLYDAIMLSQGLEGLATNFGYIISTPPNQPLNREYQVVDVKSAFEDPNSAANIIIKPNDRIVIPQTTDYMDQFFVNVSGAVRKPGQFVYDPSLSFKDVLVMAGGLKREAASNKIDIFRLKVENNEPTVTYATTIEVDHDLQPLNDNIDFEFQPFDHIVVRTTPDFEPIQYVNITGEVKYPGLYALMEPNERISSLVERAGGYTNEAFPEAGTLNRTEGNVGLVVTRLDLIMNRKYESKYNLVLKNGDAIDIPKIKEVVTISRIGTNADELYADIQLQDSTLNLVVNYHNKRAKWYVNHFAGGFDKTAKRKKTYVRLPNGRIKKTRSFLVFRVYPKVKQGSDIHIGLKEKELEKQKEEAIDVAPKPEKTFIERMTELQTIIALTTSITTTTLATISLLRQ
jgi:protein involved in polysaccharide export with SLBB domain